MYLHNNLCDIINNLYKNIYIMCFSRGKKKKEKKFKNINRSKSNKKRKNNLNKDKMSFLNS